MKIVMTGGPVLSIEHNGQSLLWDISSFDKKCFSGEYDIAYHINQFWARLPGHRQEKIFAIYTQIRYVLDTQSDTQPMVEMLQPLVTQLYAEHTLEDIGHWLVYYSDISIPDHFKDEYVATEGKTGTRDKTYIREDYQALATMALSLRCMLPIWGEFIKRMGKETGNVFKEYRAFQLLSQTPLMHSVPMEKLRVYVNRNIQSEKPMREAIMRGVGSHDYPMWLLAMVVVRRVCVGDLSINNPKTNLVTFIFNYVNNKVSGTNSNSFGEIIKPKEFDTSDVNSDVNVSRIEAYKLKQEASTGDMVLLEFFMDNPFKVLELHTPACDPALLGNFLVFAQALEKELLAPHQIIITQWMLKKVFPPRGITQLNKKATINAIAVAQTILWHNGFYEVACLMTAINSNNLEEMPLSEAGSQAKITKVQMAELERLYPYGRALSSKKASKTPNSAARAIESVAKLLTRRDWILTVSEDNVKQVTGNPNVRRYPSPDNIRVLLADISIHVANRK